MAIIRYSALMLMFYIGILLLFTKFYPVGVIFLGFFFLIVGRIIYRVRKSIKESIKEELATEKVTILDNQETNMGSAFILLVKK